MWPIDWCSPLWVVFHLCGRSIDVLLYGLFHLCGRSTDVPLYGLFHLCGRSTDGLFSMQALPALFDGPVGLQCRWSDGLYSTQALPALSDGEGEARRFTKTAMSMGRRVSLTIVLLRGSCLSGRRWSVAMSGPLIVVWSFGSGAATCPWDLSINRRVWLSLFSRFLLSFHPIHRSSFYFYR